MNVLSPQILSATATFNHKRVHDSQERQAALDTARVGGGDLLAASVHAALKRVRGERLHQNTEKHSIGLGS